MRLEEAFRSTSARFIEKGKIPGDYRRKIMSKMKQIEIECPKCDEKQLVDYWESINVDLNPSLRKQLFEAEINFFSCETCGYEAMVNGPLYYHDMSRKFCVQYLPEYWLEDVANFDCYQTDGSLETFVNFSTMGIGHRSRPHVVFDIEELLRYILFREMLYDRDALEGEEKRAAGMLH
jgi:hypothetical protein